MTLRKKIALIGGMFAFAFLSAFLLAWIIFTPAQVTPLPADSVEVRQTIGGEELTNFMQVVESEDFPAMRRLGENLFAEGNIIDNSHDVFSQYKTISYSDDYFVYALYSSIGQDRSYRVLLTMDNNNRVVSFLAEETIIAK